MSLKMKSVIIDSKTKYMHVSRNSRQMQNISSQWVGEFVLEEINIFKYSGIHLKKNSDTTDKLKH